MKTSEKVLQLLLKKQAFLSGQELADELNVSRTAVWKAIQSLQEEGYQIESKPRIGYRYIEGLKLSEASIRRFLNPELDLNFEIYDTIDSTNNRCSQKAMDPETKTPLVVISDSQKAGHGRYGRPFASPVGGGIYISILLDNDDPDFNPGLLTTATAIAVTSNIATFFFIFFLLSMKTSFYVFYPFTDPTITPFTKCFCRNGYTTMMGSIARTTVA